MTGEAYAVAGKARILFRDIIVPRTPDTGLARTAIAATTATPCAAVARVKVLGIEVFRTEQLCAKVTTGVAAGTSTSTASLQQATFGLGNLPPMIKLTGLAAHSQSSCSGASGGATLGSLTIGSFTIPVNMAPNSTVWLPFGGRVTFNEQLPVAGADRGLTVNAVHIVLPAIHGHGGVDLVLASAKSAVHNCKPEAAGPAGLVALAGSSTGSATEDGPVDPAVREDVAGAFGMTPDEANTTIPGDAALASSITAPAPGTVAVASGPAVLVPVASGPVVVPAAGGAASADEGGAASADEGDAASADEGDVAGTDESDAAGADVDSAGGCQATRTGGAPWLLALALGLALAGRRRRRRGGTTPRR
jgi:MYXO-CTERM domain-containing protein